MVILEGMFLIQTPPIPTSCMRDYVNLLLAKSVRPHLKARVTAVHVVLTTLDRSRKSLCVLT